MILLPGQYCIEYDPLSQSPAGQNRAFLCACQYPFFLALRILLSFTLSLFTDHGSVGLSDVVERNLSRIER